MGMRLFDKLVLAAIAGTILSACQTALGEEIRGEGLLGLTQGLMYAGAARVLVSLWNINDQSSSMLMEQFCDHLVTEGASPAAALRAAQTSFIRHPVWNAPYFWAAFLLQGDPLQIKTGLGGSIE